MAGGAETQNLNFAVASPELSAVLRRRNLQNLSSLDGYKERFRLIGQIKELGRLSELDTALKKAQEARDLQRRQAFRKLESGIKSYQSQREREIRIAKRKSSEAISKIQNELKRLKRLEDNLYRKWKRIKIGMTASSTKRALGKPSRASALTFVQSWTYYYQDLGTYGSVLFDEKSKIYSYNPPTGQFEHD
jgi:hypothetical protein